MEKFGVNFDKNGRRVVTYPKFARFKCVMRFRGKQGNASEDYPGYDIQPIYINHQKCWYRNEEIAWDKLMGMIRGKKPWEWYAASIFANLTDNLQWLTGDYKGYLITLYPDKESTGPGPGRTPILPVWMDYQSKKYPDMTCRKIDEKEMLYRLNWKEHQLNQKLK